MSSYWKEKALAENPFLKILSKTCAPLPIQLMFKFQVLNFPSLSCSYISFDREEQIKNKKEIRIKKKK